MSDPKVTPKNIPNMTQVAIFSKEQLNECRKELFASHGNTEHLTMSLFDQMSNQILVAVEEVKKLQSENQTLKTQLQVAELEIKKLKEKPTSKPDISPKN